MKKIFTFIFAISLAICCWGTEYQLGSNDYDAQTGPTDVYQAHFISQILYLQSSLATVGAEAGDITSISFYVKSSSAMKRQIRIFISATNNTQLTGFTSQSYSSRVFSGEVSVPSSGWYSITFDKSFTWNGSSNLLITINDTTNNWSSNKTSHYGLWNGSFGKNQIAYASKSSKGAGFDATNISASATLSKYYPSIKLNIVPSSPTPTYNKPTNVSVTAKSSTTATIGWSKNDSAKIILEYKLSTAESWTLAQGDITENSYTISGLTASTEYKYQVTAVYKTGSSDAVSGTFTTDAASSHEHDGVSFQEWTSTTALPSDPGSYFLNDNVTVSSWTVPSGDTKICLNGKTITFSTNNYYMNIGSGKSVSIYDNEGNGLITTEQSFNPTIKVNGGTLSLYGGSVSNTSSGENAFAVNVASGTFNIKGNVKMSTGSSAANIYLANNSSVITLIGAITNTTKLSVKKAANLNITSGWSTQMGSADPANYFTSKNTDAPAVVLVGDEAQLGVPAVTISETGTNTFNAGLYNVNLVRTFQAGILNTISLPFALDDEQLKAKFGADYELYELASSSLTNGVLSLMFNKVTALDDGYPYLLRISSAVENPSFSSVTLTKENHTKQTTAVDMVAVISEKEITNYDDVLFLNAAGELNWSTAAGNFKGMRAYFKLNSGSPSAVSARRIVLDTNTPTNLDDVASESKVVKKVENGKFFILKNGVKYNIQGQIVK